VSVTAAPDEALIGRLQADATLLLLAPGNVHLDVAPENTPQPYIVVTLQIETPTHEQGGMAYLVARFQIKAVQQAANASDVKAVADRIDVLLNGASFTIAGHTQMDCKRVERFGYAQFDGPLLWQHRGFDVELWCDPS
jgi:hypothetical protein